MKKLVLTMICASAMVGAAFAQGTVDWGSINPGSVTARTNSTLYSPLFGGGTLVGGAVGNTTGSAITGVSGYYYELLYNSVYTGVQVSGALAPSNSFATLFGGTWLDAGLSGTNGNTASRLAVINPSGAAIVPWSPGTTDNIVLVGWSANLGSSWLTVSNLLATSTYATKLNGANGFFGVSAAGYTTTLASTSLAGNEVFGAGSGGNLPIISLLTPLDLLPVPEPSTIALAGLGGLALLLFRRRK